MTIEWLNAFDLKVPVCFFSSILLFQCIIILWAHAAPCQFQRFTRCYRDGKGKASLLRGKCMKAKVAINSSPKRKAKQPLPKHAKKRKQAILLLELRNFEIEWLVWEFEYYKLFLSSSFIVYSAICETLFAQFQAMKRPASKELQAEAFTGIKIEIQDLPV